MSDPSELTACFYYPDTYKLEIEPSAMDDILHLFCDNILQGCSFSELESCLLDYVTSIIEPVGWKAVWRCKRNPVELFTEYDFIVEVLNVSLLKLEAEISIRSVILEEKHEYLLHDLRKQINMNEVISVPLIELYTISEEDGEELFAKTAIAIENVRFFMSYLARPWDGEDDDVVYSEKVIKPRLQLYFDMQNHILPRRMISKIQCILKQGWSTLHELNMLYSDMNVNDSDADISEDDVLQSMSLRTKLSELKAKMEILENPVIRAFMMKKYVPCKPTRNRKKSTPVTYVIAKEFTYEMIANIPVDASSVLEFEHNAETAFKLCSSGDKILIFPGIYQCDTLGWMDGEVSVEGIGTRSEIVLEATGNSDVFLNCTSPNLSLKNVCLKAKKGLLSAIVVHRGEIFLNNCVVDSNGASIGILLLGGSVARLEDSSISNAEEDGIQMRSLSSLYLTSCDINCCKRHGVQIDAEASNSTDCCTEISIVKSFITKNEGHGIFLNNVALTSLSLQRPSGDFSILKLFHWLKSNIEDSEIQNNQETDIGFSSICKSERKESVSAKKSFSSFSNQDDLNCSAMSDFLNEISFTDF